MLTHAASCSRDKDNLATDVFPSWRNEILEYSDDPKI